MAGAEAQQHHLAAHWGRRAWGDVHWWHLPGHKIGWESSHSGRKWRRQECGSGNRQAPPGMWVWQSAIGAVADHKHAYKNPVADNSQIESVLPRKFLFENYRRLDSYKHVCDRRLAQSPIARPGTGFGLSERIP